MPAGHIDAKTSKRGPRQNAFANLSPSIVTYSASPTLRKFHSSNSFHRVVIGPVGSGKSTGMCMEVFRRAAEQAPIIGGNERLTRWSVIRATYRELHDTTFRTWMDWLGQVPGEFNVADFTHRLLFSLPDGTVVNAEILFRALDRPRDIAKLLSLELTGAWINEIRETPKSLIDALDDRVGRYPPRRLGGCTYRGIMGDTNPPDNDHYLYTFSEIKCPDNWIIWKQPGGLIELPGEEFVENPEAENIDNLEEHYYLNRIGGKSKEHIRVYYCAQFGFISEGRPVIPEYVDSTHSRTGLTYDPFLPIYVGIDFGLTPAAVIAQRRSNGRWEFIDEMTSDHLGILRFGSALKIHLTEHYSKSAWIITGDPAGTGESQTDEETPFNVLKTLGLSALPANTNDWLIRRETLAAPMNRMIDGDPGFLLDSVKCPRFRKGLMGGYYYRRIYVSGQERYADSPSKTIYSHPVDAGMYLLLGAGEGRIVASGTQPLLGISTLETIYERQAIPTGREVWGILICPNQSRTILVRRRGALQVGEIETYTSVDMASVMSWLESKIGIKKPFPQLCINSDGTGARLATEMRREGHFVKLIQAGNIAGGFKTELDKLTFLLKDWLENSNTQLVDYKIGPMLSCATYTSDRNGIISVVCSEEIKALALTMACRSDMEGEIEFSRPPTAMAR